MAEDGIRTPNVTAAAALDDVMGNVSVDGVLKTRRQPFAEHAAQLVGTGPLAEVLSGLDQRMTDIEAIGDNIIKPTWTGGLAAVAGTRGGQRGEVGNADAGTHVDPITGLTVPNAGIYSWVDVGPPTGWQRVGDNDVGAVKSEIATARGPEPTLADRLVGIDNEIVLNNAANAAMTRRIEVQEVASTDARTVDMLSSSDFRDPGGAYLWRFDDWGRMQVRRDSDPEDVARVGSFVTDRSGAQLYAVNAFGVLTETGQGIGGVAFLGTGDKPTVITGRGEQVELSQAAAARVARSGPDLYIAAYARPMIGPYQMRLHSTRPLSEGGSIIAGLVVVWSEIAGQSNGPGSGSSGDIIVQPQHPWASAAKMLARIDQAPDVRLGVQAVETTTQLFSETLITGLDDYQETQGVGGYGGQTAFASYIDRLMTNFERDVGRPPVLLPVVTATGGASWAEQTPPSETWTKTSRARKAGRRVVNSQGFDIVRAPRKVLHGEGDILRCTQVSIAAMIAGTAGQLYGGDLKEWRSLDDAAAIADLGLHASHEGMDIYITPGRDLAGQPRVSAAMAMSWAARLDPAHHAVAGPGYPIMAAYGVGADPQHYPRAGLEIIGELLAICEYERFWRLNDAWRPCEIVDVRYVDSTHVDVDIRVVTLPLVVDTTIVAARPGNGFVILINDTPGSAVAIASQTVHAIVGNIVTLRLTTATPIPGSFTHRGLAYGCLGVPGAAAGTLEILPAGNIRDSTPIPTRLPGVTWHHWLIPHCIPF